MNPSILITPNAVEAGKLFSIIPTNGAGDLDVVRATSATYVGADGLIKTALANVPRLDYTNGSCPSILVEQQRTNLLLYSNALTTSPWGVAESPIITNLPNEITPFGLGAFLMQSTMEGSRVQQSVTLNNNLQSVSIFIKGNNQNAQFRLQTSAFSGGITVNFDSSNNLTFNSVNLGTYTIEQFANNWYRLTFNLSTAVPINSFIQLRIQSGSVKVCHAQSEAGSNATSYIPTTTTAVTRNADVISKSGISSLIGQTEGAVFIDFIGTPQSNTYFSIGANLNNCLLIGINPAGLLNARIFGVFPTVIINCGTFTYNPNTRYKIAFSYNSAECIVSVNGVSQKSIGYAGFPTIQNRIGFDNSSGAGVLSGLIKNTLIFKNSFSELELNNLTTI